MSLYRILDSDLIGFAPSLSLGSNQDVEGFTTDLKAKECGILEMQVSESHEGIRR